MTVKQYEKFSAPFRTEKGRKLLIITNKILTFTGYLAYPLLLLFVLLEKGLFGTVPFVAIPGVGFVLLSLIRAKINRPRPYEALGITPIIPKDTKGNSMPSRHVFSLGIIAVSWFMVSQPVGALLFVGTIAIAFIRVAAGVHYPLDVMVGALSALIWGVFWFNLVI